ncbi:MAG: carboxypeptidase-like regulatory domain-containing protein [Bacteroidales bacterium]|nr:carboxypeptidase-like regulatory domain-containing protein [Bacteroidales bacterium]
MKQKKILFIVIVWFASLFSGYGQEKLAQYSFQNKSIPFIIENIEKVYQCQFTYPSELLSKQKNKNINIKNKSLNEVLKLLFDGTDIKYSKKGSLIILSKKKEKQKFILSGKILEQESGETLIGATIYCQKYGIGTASNQFGFFSIELPEGKNELEISFIGHAQKKQTINLTKNLKLNFVLEQATEKFDEVVVTAQAANANVNNIKMSRTKVQIETIKSMPSFLGEVDVMKSLQMLPGVQSSGDATSNLNVRGGSFDQNLILLDDAPIYNPSHALGFFSVFNADAIKNVEVYKGGQPARYGERLSSVVDIRMKDGNLKKYEGNITLGTIASKLSFEGPIIKDKASFLITGRYSYAGFVADNFADIAYDIGLFRSDLANYKKGNKVNFYDLNLKLNYIIDDNNRLFFSAYSGRDNFYFKLINEKSSMDWGNLTSTLRWNKIINKRLFTNTTLVFSNFDYSYYIKDDIRDFEWSSNLQEVALKSDFDYYHNARNEMKFGLSVNYHRINPGEIAPRSDSSITKYSKLQDNYGIEAAVYISNSQKITDRFRVEYGLRLSSFFRFGEATMNQYASDNYSKVVGVKKYKSNEIHKSYTNLDPRLNMRYSINDRNSIKASYARTSQYLQLLSTSSIGLPTDVWYLADLYTKPQTANIFALGYFKNLRSNIYESSIELYYKNMQNQIDFIDNADLFLNSSIEQEIKSGKGWSYGAEFMIKKSQGKFKGWISYTWAKTQLKINGINKGNPYPTRYDKRNDLSLMLSYDLTKRLVVSSNFTYSTGGALTAPVGTFAFQGISPNYYTDRNGYRLPDYHRLDFSLILKPKEKRKWKGQWAFSIYNAYNRHNAFSIYTKAQDYNVSASDSHMIYMFGIVPSISYKLKF